MYVVILNWKDGENDPFSFFSNSLKSHFEKFGHPTKIINLDDDFGANLDKAYAEGIYFAFSWQGLGSTIACDNGSTKTIWEHLRVPLICCHGDHPCHTPANHNADSKFIRHLYGAPSFARFANQYIRSHVNGIYLPLPTIFPNEVRGAFSGKYFVFPKNFDDNEVTFKAWSEAPYKELAGFLFNAAEEFIHEIGNGSDVDHHQTIDKLLKHETLDLISRELGGAPLLPTRFHIHFLLDKIYRNTLTEYAIKELRDVPMKIFGRGWDRFKKLENKNHEFLEFGTLSGGGSQYSSEYGIIDIAPIFDSLHDRTLRAMANDSSFIIGSNWPSGDLLGKNFANLFFGGEKDALRNQAEKIIENPERHRCDCVEFKLRYQQQFSAYTFIKQLENIAGSMNRSL